MNHHHHAGQNIQPETPNQRSAPSLSRLAFAATVHCLTGCAIGEVLGMVIGPRSAGATLPRS